MKPRLSFTFDDGRLIHFSQMAPLLERFGFHGTFYVMPGLVEKRTSVWVRPTGIRTYIAGWYDIHDAVKQGHEIGNHSWDHPRFVQMENSAKEYLHKQIVESADILEAETGQVQFTWAWPYYEEYRPGKRLVLEKHSGIRPKENRRSYNHRWTPEGGITGKQANEWVDHIIKEKLWGIAVIHDVEAGFRPVLLNTFANHLAYVQEIGIDVVTVREGLR